MDICLEMFNCLSGEQTVAMRKTKFLKTVSNSSNMLCRTFAVEASKRTGDLIKSCHISYKCKKLVSLKHGVRAINQT